MNDIVVFVFGIFVGLVFVVPAYQYGRIQGVAWATEKTKEMFKRAGMIFDE